MAYKATLAAAKLTKDGMGDYDWVGLAREFLEIMALDAEDNFRG